MNSSYYYVSLHLLFFFVRLQVVHQLYLELSPDGGAQAEADLGGQRIQARPYNLQVS